MNIKDGIADRENGRFKDLSRVHSPRKIAREN